MIATSEQVTAWFPTAPAEDLAVAHDAAESFIASRCRWPLVASDGSVLDAPDALKQAVKLLVGRYLARRNSPDGIVGMDDLGAVRVGATDRDVEALIAPWKPVVFG